MNQVAQIDVQQIIDRQPFSRHQLKITLLCAASLFMDGFDAQAIGFVAPALSDEWHIPRAALSPVLSSGLAGMLCGALLFGTLADRFGRKPILILCTLWFGVFSLLTATANSVQEMIILRLITGFGLGGCLPNAIALTSEYMPVRHRATGVILMGSGFSVGAAVGGFAAANIISIWGWQGVFILGGALPCVVALALFALPESIRFLVIKGGHERKVADFLRKIAPEVKVPADSTFTMGEEPKRGFSVGQLFSEGRTKITLLLWVIFFMSLLDLYFLNSWLPTVLRDDGVPVETAIRITAMFQLGGAVGVLVLGRYFDKRESYRPLIWVWIGASASVFFIGMAGGSVPLQTLAVFLAGVCVVGGQTSANSMAAECYPTAIRSTGVGWSLGIGRVGSIVGPIVGGLLLSAQPDIKRVFLAAAAPPLVGSLAAVWVTARMKRRGEKL